MTRPIVINGGSVGDPATTGAGQTINSPINFTGANRPNLTAVGGNGTTFAGQITDSGFTGSGVDKRGAGLLILSNTANTFSGPLNIRAGTLRAIYNTAFPGGGVSPAAPITTTDTPLGTNKNITLSGGTLGLLANMANNNTQQVWDSGFNITLDGAPSGMAFDRIAANTAQVDKMVRISSLTFAPASASNQYAIGQNNFTFTQGNTHRLEIPSMTMNSDTTLSTGDFQMSGTVASSNKNSLIHAGSNTIQFVSGSTMDFNAFFNAAGTLRVGDGYGTPVVNNTATVGNGAIYLAPGTVAGFRTPTNLAPNQVVDLLSQKINLAQVNFQQIGVAAGAAAIPTNIRALTSGIYGIGGATYSTLDVSKIGDGTFRIGSNIAGAGNGTVTGAVAPGAGNLVRLGGGGIATFSGTNAITGTAGLEVGAGLIANTTPSSSSGTVILGATNNFTGGTTVNRSSTLTVQNLSLGTGAVNVFGTLSLEQAAGALTSNGLTNVNALTLYGGSTLSLNNNALSGTVDTNRLGDNDPLTLNASTLTLNSRNNNASTTTEKVGTLNYAGGSVINVNRQNQVAGNVMALNVDSFTRSGTGTLEIARTSGTGAGFGVGQFVKALVTAPTVTNGMISPSITVNDGTRLTNFATYGANGIDNAVPTATVNTAAFTTGLTGGTGIVYVDFAAAALTSTLGDNPVGLWPEGRRRTGCRISHHDRHRRGNKHHDSQWRPDCLGGHNFRLLQHRRGHADDDQPGAYFQ